MFNISYRKYDSMHCIEGREGSSTAHILGRNVLLFKKKKTHLSIDFLTFNTVLLLLCCCCFYLVVVLNICCLFVIIIDCFFFFYLFPTNTCICKREPGTEFWYKYKFSMCVFCLSRERDSCKYFDKTPAVSL